MKKLFVPFCAIFLFSTQLPAVNAANISEDSKSESILVEAKGITINQYDGYYCKVIDQLKNVDRNNFVDFNKKLLITKNTLEKLLTKKINEQIAVTTSKTTVEQPQQPAKDSTQHTANDFTKNTAVNEKTNNTNTVPKTNQTEAVPSQKNEQAKQDKWEYVQPTTPTNPTQNNTKQQQTNQVTKPSTQVTQSGSVSEYEQKVIELTNAERAKAGLPALQMYTPLMKVAREKSQDMATNHYFTHTSPTYGSPFDQMKSAGISYRAAGENIAQGQRTPEEVVNAWMNSPGHRANILNANYTHIGVGFIQNGNYWTQQFIQL